MAACRWGILKGCSRPSELRAIPVHLEVRSTPEARTKAAPARLSAVGSVCRFREADVDKPDADKEMDDPAPATRQEFQNVVRAPEVDCVSESMGAAAASLSRASMRALRACLALTGGPSWRATFFVDSALMFSAAAAGRGEVEPAEADAGSSCKLPSMTRS
jgi:hypothetical protein